MGRIKCMGILRWGGEGGGMNGGMGGVRGGGM